MALKGWIRVVRFFRWLFRRKPKAPQPSPTSISRVVDGSITVSQMATMMEILEALKSGDEQLITTMQARFQESGEQAAQISQLLTELQQLVQSVRSRSASDASTLHTEVERIHLLFLQQNPDRAGPPIIIDQGNIVYRFDPQQQCEVRLVSQFNPLYVIRLFLPRGDLARQGPYARVDPLEEIELDNGDLVTRVALHLHEGTLPPALFEFLLKAWAEYWFLFWLIIHEEDDQHTINSLAYPGAGRRSCKKPGDTDRHGDPMPLAYQKDYIFYFDRAREAKVSARANQVAR
jgi:hypothetical protein